MKRFRITVDQDVFMQYSSIQPKLGFLFITTDSNCRSPFEMIRKTGDQDIFMPGYLISSIQSKLRVNGIFGSSARAFWFLFISNFLRIGYPLIVYLIEKVSFHEMKIFLQY